MENEPLLYPKKIGNSIMSKFKFKTQASIAVAISLGLQVPGFSRPVHANPVILAPAAF